MTTRRAGKRRRWLSVPRAEVTVTLLAALLIVSIHTPAASQEGGTTPVASKPPPPPVLKRVDWMTDDEVALFIPWVHVAKPTTAERVEFCAKLSVDRPYVENAPMFDHRSADCVTFVEQMLAMGMADSYESYIQLVTRLRYAGGEVPLAPQQLVFADHRLKTLDPAAESLLLLNRNHFIEADWNRNNTWCLQDITKDLGAGPIKPWIPMHHIVHRKDFFAKKGLSVETPDEKLIDAFIPRESVADIINELQPGDVVEVIVGTLENRYCEHMGVIINEPRWGRPEGPVYIVHAAPPKVKREPLLYFLKRFPFVQGFKFLRLRPEADDAAYLESAGMASRLPAVSVSNP